MPAPGIVPGPDFPQTEHSNQRWTTQGRNITRPEEQNRA